MNSQQALGSTQSGLHRYKFQLLIDFTLCCAEGPYPPSRVVNGYLAAACLMGDSLDASSNEAIARLVRGEESIPGTGCPGAWAEMSAKQLRSLEQTKCEDLSKVAGVPISWPACCEGGPGDTCTDPPPNSSADELCGACPLIAHSSLGDDGRWFDDHPMSSTFSCYEVTNRTDKCQLSLDDMRTHCSRAMENAHTRSALPTETWKCFASIARVRPLLHSLPPSPTPVPLARGPITRLLCADNCRVT